MARLVLICFFLLFGVSSNLDEYILIEHIGAENFHVPSLLIIPKDEESYSVQPGCREFTFTENEFMLFKDFILHEKLKKSRKCDDVGKTFGTFRIIVYKNSKRKCFKINSRKESIVFYNRLYNFSLSYDLSNEFTDYMIEFINTLNYVDSSLKSELTYIGNSETE